MMLTEREDENFWEETEEKWTGGYYYSPERPAIVVRCSHCKSETFRVAHDSCLTAIECAGCGKKATIHEG
jgi:ribosomal protein S27E